MARAIVNVANGNIGDIRHSMLTLAQFQAANGTGWVEMNGTSCVGTKYATITGNTTLPDARGLFLRTAGTHGSTLNGKTPSATFNVKQGDATAKNGLTASSTSSVPLYSGGTRTANLIAVIGNTSNYPSVAETATVTTTTTISAGDTETRPANLPVNVFIKVN